MILLILFLHVYEILGWGTLSGSQTSIIGHRGDAFYMPEHSLGAYTLGAYEGADYVEADLVLSLDGIPVCSHNAYLSTTTNVADLPQFGNRQRNLSIDNGPVRSDWWYEDFLLSELKILKLKQAVENPYLRNHAFDNLFEILTFEEHLSLVQNLSLALNKTIEIIPEIKHSQHYSQFNVNQGRTATYFEDTVMTVLGQFNYSCLHSYNVSETSMFIQSFEVENLQYLHTKCLYPLLLLLNDSTTQTTSEALRGIATYAKAIGMDKNDLKANPNVLRMAHDVGLLVSIYTIRNAKEDEIVVTDYGGDLNEEYKYYFDLGVDSIFSEKVDEAISSREHYVSGNDDIALLKNQVMDWQIGFTLMGVLSLFLFIQWVYMCHKKKVEQEKKNSSLLHTHDAKEHSSSFDNVK